MAHAASAKILKDRVRGGLSLRLMILEIKVGWAKATPCPSLLCYLRRE
jgi:hypothetical protein